MRYFIAVLICLVFISCSNKDFNNTVYIEGVNKELRGETIYLKTNDHFDFLNENFELDSTVVDSLGKFKFEIKIDEPLLVKIDKYDDVLAGTLTVFKETPQHYQYLLCKNFLAFDPTLYLEPGKKYNIENWIYSHDLDAVKYKDANHNLMRRYYYESEYYDAVRANRTAKDISIDSAWNNVNAVKEKLLRDYNVLGEQPKDSFEHYLRSEIILGASNWFFNWFDVLDKTDFENDTYQNALAVYNTEVWNKNSLHYFKITERLINDKLNHKYNSFKVYYKPSKEKLKMARQFAGANIKNQYTANIEKLLE